MCHRVRQTTVPTVVDGVHLNGRRHYEIGKANHRESWPMLKTRLALFVISSALVLGSLGAAAKSSETQHAVDEQNFEFEETIDRELELFRGAQVSLQQALLIAERLHTGSRVVDISFDGASNPPVYRVKTIQIEQIWENSIDAKTGSSSAGGKHALYVKDLEAQDRRNLLALRAVRQKLSDAVVVAERSTRGKAISGGLMNEDGTLYFVVVDTADGLKQVLLEPPRVRGR
jgi:uncharacterized membrane protein YkoI